MTYGYLKVSVVSISYMYRTLTHDTCRYLLDIQKLFQIFMIQNFASQNHACFQKIIQLGSWPCPFSSEGYILPKTYIKSLLTKNDRPQMSYKV